MDVVLGEYSSIREVFSSCSEGSLPSIIRTPWISSCPHKDKGRKKEPGEIRRAKRKPIAALVFPAFVWSATRASNK